MGLQKLLYKSSPRDGLEGMTPYHGEMGVGVPSNSVDDISDPGSRASTGECTTDMSTYFIRKSLSEKSKRNAWVSSSWNSSSNDWLESTTRRNQLYIFFPGRRTAGEFRDHAMGQ